MEKAWHGLTTGEVVSRLGTNEGGLTEAEVQHRAAKYGPNRLRPEKRESIWEMVLEEIREPMILLLLVTGVLYALLGESGDALTIFFVIFTLMAVEILNERRAHRAIAALDRLSEPTTAVRRDGRPMEISAEAVVPGDILLLQSGRRLPADAYLLEAFSLSADESALTGESVPVDKEAGAVLPLEMPLGDRRNLVLAGTTITRGRGLAAVVATGMDTELGRIAALVKPAKPPRTPLQLAMRDVSKWLVGLALGFSILIPLLGWLIVGQPLGTMLLTGLTLAFATIPEEMPIIITMVLAIGGYRLSQQKAIVKQLRAVESLGAITLIATDKTGTLTENRMAVSRLYPDQASRRLLEIGALCNSATDANGDPLEVALLQAARTQGLDVDALQRSMPLQDEFSFDNARNRMSAVYARDDGFWVAVKGAPESVLARSTRLWEPSGDRALGADGRAVALATADQMAADGLRVIALAEKSVPDHGRLNEESAEANLTFVGLTGLADPARPDVKEAIAVCRGAGIRTIMVTGDHPATARAVAGQVGLNGDSRLVTGLELDALTEAALERTVGEVSIYARTTPENKLRLVRALHGRGERVAVTGDGTNDAPALAAADIGIAMGETGTDVARAAAGIVLADDNFSTLARAVREGRILFANLRKGVRYYLACKVALILAMLLPTLLGMAMPFAPVQIILMELFMDLAASAAFVVEPAEDDLMRRPPRDPRTPFMDRPMIASILGSGVGLFAAVSAAYLGTWYRTGDVPQAQTMAFATWLVGHVLLALNMRSEREPLIRLGLLSNRAMVYWAAATVVFLLAAAYIPVIQAAVKVVTLSLRDWVIVLGAAVAGTFWLELRKVFSSQV